MPARPSHSTVILVDPTVIDRDYVIDPNMGGEVHAVSVDTSEFQGAGGAVCRLTLAPGTPA